MSSLTLLLRLFKEVSALAPFISSSNKGGQWTLTPFTLGEIIAIVRQPDTSDRLSKEGADPVGNSPQEFGRFIQSEIDKWRKVIRAAGILPG